MSHSPRKRNRISTSYEAFEPKRLLAGDVTVFQTEDIAYLRGDQSDNQVEIVANEEGQVVIRGLEETTINGEAELVLESENSTIGRLGIHMGRGNDTLNVAGIDVSRRVIVYGGTGDDAIGFSNVTTGSDLIANPWRGDDLLSIDNVEIGGRLVAYTGPGNDSVGIDNSVVEGRTLIGTGHGEDRLAIRNSNLNGSVFAFSGSGNDFVAIENVTTNRFAAFVAGNGDDDVIVTQSTFNGNVFASGREGTDNLQSSDNEFSGQRYRRSFEGETVENATQRLDSVFADLVDAGIRTDSGDV